MTPMSGLQGDREPPLFKQTVQIDCVLCAAQRDICKERERKSWHDCVHSDCIFLHLLSDPARSGQAPLLFRDSLTPR